MFFKQLVYDVKRYNLLEMRIGFSVKVSNFQDDLFPTSVLNLEGPHTQPIKYFSFFQLVFQQLNGVELKEIIM